MVGKCCKGGVLHPILEVQPSAERFAFGDVAEVAPPELPGMAALFHLDGRQSGRWGLEGYRRSLKILRECSSPDGFLAAPGDRAKLPPDVVA